MKTIPAPANPRADEQAALWAARLDGSPLDIPTQAALEAWLAADPAHRTLLSHYCQFSADLEETLPVLVAEGSVRMPAEKKSRRPRFAWFAGLAFATAAVVTFGLWFGRGSHGGVEKHVTAIAQRQPITLSDGTRIEMNAHTSLLVEITAKERHVRLAGGEAFFAVTKDPSRPFIVDTPAGSVRVTGTQFAVRTESTAELEVTVAEGSVQVRPGELGGEDSAAPIALAAGDRLSANPAQPNAIKLEKLSAAAIGDVLAWREGRIVCDGMRLQEALARFARYHGVGLRAVGGAADLIPGGRYSLDDLDTFLSSLPQSLPVRVMKDSSGTQLVLLR